MKFAYLRSLQDLDLRLEACNASSASETAALIHSLQYPLGGVFLMTLVLSDALFVKQKQEDFETVRNVKQVSFDVIASQLDVNSLDFVVHLSSVSGLFGFVAQANYAR